MRSRWWALVAVGVASACAACGDDESAQEGGGGSGGGDATTSSSGTPTSSSNGTSTSSGATTSSSTGGPGACPELAPLDGDACTPTEPATCHYDMEAVCPDGAFTNASVDATCEGGVWTIAAESSGECCPEAVTQSGAIPCFIDGSTCEYEGDVVCSKGGAIGGGVTATCDGETWQTVYVPTGGTCEGKTPCPAEPPSPNSECNPEVDDVCMWEAASPCPDGPGFNVITVAKCNAGFGEWSVGTIFEGTECSTCDDDTCAVEGIACASEVPACEGGGVAVTGTICEGGDPHVKWDDLSSCE